MASPNHVHVGVFGKRNVPEDLKGAHIYFSPELKKFATVKDGITKNYFGFNKYRSFTEAGVILFDSTTQEYIDREYESWYDEQQEKIEQELRAKRLIDPDDMSQAEEQEDADAKITYKDPTKMLLPFFTTCAIIALIAIIIRVVIIPLIILMREAA